MVIIVIEKQAGYTPTFYSLDKVRGTIMVLVMVLVLIIKVIIEQTGNNPAFYSLDKVMVMVMV